jgi:hypothetical protein
VNDEPNPEKRPRTALVGALAIVALFGSFVLAIMSRGRTDMPLVIVAPSGTSVTVNDRQPRDLPQQPNTSQGLSSYYFFVDQGDHEVRFREPGKAERLQTLTIPASRVPIIYTLLNDTLREMKARNR